MYMAEQSTNMQSELINRVNTLHEEGQAVESRLRRLESQTVLDHYHLSSMAEILLPDHQSRKNVLSVVVPVYNALPYLRESLDSILAQTFPYFELICVDDGSTDGSAEVLDAYARKEERLKVIHQKNSGAGAARNRGLELIQGKYVLFLDADDIYQSDMFEKMFACAERCQADVVVCKAKGFQEGCKNIWPLYCIKEENLPGAVFSGTDCAAGLFQTFVGWPWDKMFRSSLLKQNGLKFPEVGNTEDAYLVYLALAEARRIVPLSEELVLHRFHTDSLEGRTRGKTLEHLRVYDCIQNYMQDRGIFDLFRQSFFNFVVHHGIWSLKTNSHKDNNFFHTNSYITLKNYLENTFHASSLPHAFYYNDDEYEFIHSMFTKKKCHFQYSVITACYNVESYIDDMLKSLANQTIDFTQNIECILIDDGSTDGTAEKIKHWMEKYPNIIYIHKENGGASSARNLGLTKASKPWVTFIDSDDFIHPDYFYQIDAYLAEHADDTALIAGRIVFYNEKNNSFSANHALDYKFINAINKVHIKNIDKELQFAANSAFFRRDVFIQNKLQFSEKCRPKFEDANLITKYMYFTSDKNYICLKNAIYFYRKRSNQTSLIDKSWTQKESYKDLIKYGYIDAVKFYKIHIGYVPKFLQNMIMYELCWFFRTLVNKDAMISFLSDKDVDQFWELFTELVSFLDEDTIVHDPWAWIGREDRVPMVERILHKPYPQEEYLICGYDISKNMVHLSHIEAEGNTGTIFINGQPAHVVTRKFQSRNFMRRDWAVITHEWISINGYEDNAVLTASMADGRQTDLLIRKKFGGKKITLGTLKELFALPPAQEGSRYADAWLVMDRDTDADDNGEHFYRWLLKHHPEQKAFFVLRKTARDWKRLEKEGFMLVDFDSPEYAKLFKNCSKIISAHADWYIFASYNEHCYKDFVFLQHGVIKDDLSSWVNGFSATMFITSAKKEYESISENMNHYKYSKKEVILTGLPRHDALLSSSVKKQNQILIIPTWRNYIVGNMIHGNQRTKNPLFMETDYFKSWYAVLHSKKLKELAEAYNYRIIFYPHQNSQIYIDEFDCPDYIKAVHQGECSIQKLFLGSSVMVTDYSSVAFEMAYLERPVLYYQFDQNKYFQSHFTKGYFDYRRDGFGPVVVTERALMDELEHILEQNCIMDEPYRSRLQGFFAYRDGKCCERTYNAIKSLDTPDLPEQVSSSE